MLCCECTVVPGGAHATLGVANGGSPFLAQSLSCHSLVAPLPSLGWRSRGPEKLQNVMAVTEVLALF